MAVATTKGNEDRDPMADDDDSERQLVRVEPRKKGGDGEGPDDEGGGGGGSAPVATGGGFFSIYKSGQGYWTRMLTGAAGALLLALICHWLYATVLVRWARPAPPAEQTGLTVPHRVMIVTAFALGIIFLAWRQMNKPRVVDFLIATESEMKKVNWTDRKALIGSTKVVIIFMFLIAIILFLFDVLFGWVFFGIGILKHRPF
jgi:preprotein translocase SecE subunit